MCRIVRRVLGLPIHIGGETHAGWLPKGAATPLPTPIRVVNFNFEIEFDGQGYLLCYCSEDKSIQGDSWHQTLGEAEGQALRQFGIEASHWHPTVF